MPTPRKRSQRPVPQPARRPKVAGRGARGIRPAQPTSSATAADLGAELEETQEVNGSPLVEDAVTEESLGEDTAIAHAGQQTTEAPPVTEEPAEQPEADETAADDAEPSAREGLKLRLAAVCALLAVLCAGLAVYFVLSTEDANVALTDRPATTAVQQQVSKDLNAIMSYDYRNPGATDRAAREALGDDKLAGDYSDVITFLKKNGPKLQFSVQTTVDKSGVMELRGDRAVVLVLATQTYTKGPQGAAQQGAAQQGAAWARLRVNAQLDDNRWRITDIEQY